MIFTEPTPFAAAVEHSAVKALLPSSLNSAEAAEHLDAEILERARFSSQISNAEILDELGRQVDALVAGKTDLATARNLLRAKAQELGYRPEPGKEGSIQDFTSIRRLNIALTTNVQMAQGYGQYMQGQDPVVLDLYPAQELYRAQSRKVPRNWAARWSDAARKTRTQVSGFVALKNTDIWTAISRFGTPYSPYDYNSGMRTRAVARARAVALGLIDRDTQITPQSRDFNQDLAVTPDIRDERLRAAITEGNPAVHFDAAGTLRLKPTRSAGNEAGDEPTDAEVARAIVEAYDPADPETWDIGDDERELFDEDVLAKLALARYLAALCNVDADPVQTAGNAAGPHHSSRQLRCPVGTVKGGRFTRSLAACGGPSAAARGQKARGQKKSAAPKAAPTPVMPFAPNAAEARARLARLDALTGPEKRRAVVAEYRAADQAEEESFRHLEDTRAFNAAGRRARAARQALAELDQHERRAREQARTVVQVEEAQRPAIRLHAVDESVRGAAERGAAELAKYVHRDAWADRTFAALELRGGAARANADPFGRMHIARDEADHVVAHEAMHHHERDPEVLRESAAFLARRTAGETTRPLSEIEPGSGYEAHEAAREDEWSKRGGTAYTGKEYLDHAGSVRATEILSTGVQRMMRDPAEFARNDPDFFDFTFHALRRPRRSHGNTGYL